MSELASIDIELNEKLNPLNFIEGCTNSNWSFNNSQELVYLPLGDDGMFDWKCINSKGWQTIEHEIRQKELSNETIGLVMIDTSSNSGGELLLWSGYDSLSLSLSINAKKTEKGIDFEYYATKLKSTLESVGASISKIEYELR